MLLFAGPALAEPQVYALSPAEAAAAKEAASHRTDTDTPALLPDPERDRALATSLYPTEPRRDRAVHGEVGMMIGSGGARGIYGAFGVPLGETGFASFSFENTQLPTNQGYFGQPFGTRR